MEIRLNPLARSIRNGASTAFGKIVTDWNGLELMLDRAIQHRVVQTGQKCITGAMDD